MELGKYIRLKKDFINSEIMELAAESALLRLIRQTGKNTEELCESDQDNSSFHYKEEYQGLFDKYYDEAYDRIAGLIKFDVAQDDGIDKGTKEAVLCEEMAYAVNGAFDYKAFAEQTGRRTSDRTAMYVLSDAMRDVAHGIGGHSHRRPQPRRIRVVFERGRHFRKTSFCRWSDPGGIL